MLGLRNGAFIVFTALVLLSPGVGFVASAVQRAVPKSVLEGRNRPEMPAITLNAVVRGRAQSAFDAVLAFSAPRRDDALLVHAKWQRLLVGFAARAFAFDAYPTFYGSQYCRLGQAAAITEIPGKASPAEAWLLMSIAQRYSDFMEKFPAVRWVFALADRSGFSEACPPHGLVSNPLDYAMYRKYFLAGLTARCTVVDLGYGAGEDFHADFFRTDHHWRIQGAVRAYGRIADALGIEPIRFEAPAPVTGTVFWGSFSRSGLDADVPGEAVYDVVYKRSPLRVSVNGKAKPESFLVRDRARKRSATSSKFDNLYARRFYHGSGELRITNQGKDSTLLIVGDSFALCMEHFFAESYREVYRLDPRHDVVTLAEFLDSHHVDDALFLLTPGVVASEPFLRSLLP